MSDEDLKPCPFCGNSEISSGECLGEDHLGRKYKQTGCQKCGAFGPIVFVDDIYDDAGCDAAWNKRAATTATKGEEG